ncbi:hypothetical protein BG004_000036 [Podila humilis]|nr:hypothetical protein BG004_000036 [Podila humilis]
MNVPGIDLAKKAALVISLDENLTVQEKVEMFVRETNKRRLKDKEPARAEQFQISTRIFHDTPMERLQYLHHLRDQQIQVARANYFQRSQIPFYQPNRSMVQEIELGLEKGTALSHGHYLKSVVSSRQRL